MNLDLFQLGRSLHIAAGSVALVTFWIAACSVKGSPLHKRAGRIYLCALIAVLALSTLMVAGQAQQGDAGRAVFLAFLISLVSTATWLMWFAIRGRNDRERFLGWTYRGLATWLIAAGSAMLVLGVMRGRPLMILLSLLGIGFGANMWRLVFAGVHGRVWWLQQHMNGAMLNFVATHDSFFALGVGSVVPELRQPVPRMLIALAVILIGLGLRIWIGKRHLRRMTSADPCSPQTTV